MPLVQTRGAASAQGFGEFAQAAVAANYIEEMFSCFIYTGTGATQTITNGIDLAGEGGLVWDKSRTVSRAAQLIDSARGVNKVLNPNNVDPQQTIASTISSFDSTGFTLGAGDGNNPGESYVAWTWRKQPKFFDVVTYTGTGSNTTIAHNLGAVPGCIIVKTLGSGYDWNTWHRSGTQLNSYSLALNSTRAYQNTGDDLWGTVGGVPNMNSATFSVGSYGAVNASGQTYVAYLFAHDAGGFGLMGTDNVISCGSFTTDGSGLATVSLGYEPQWVMAKSTSAAGNWFMFDTMRGYTADTTSGTDARLYANTSGAEVDTTAYGGPNATGFTGYIAASTTYIYIAIRRGPMKVPTTGTSVFSPNAASSGTQTTGFPVDMQILSYRTGTDAFLNHQFIDRLRGVSSTSTAQGNYLNSSSTAAESNATPYSSINMNNTGFDVGNNYAGASSVFHSFRRAPGFFDVVCYTGVGYPSNTLTHNLAAVPELMIVKRRSSAGAPWYVYTAATGNANRLQLNTTDAIISTIYAWNSTTPTASYFYVGDDGGVNGSGSTYVAYLFATLAGVSKVGSYTGTGTTLQINCGFTAGARFVLIKRTDSTGDWYVWDSARGIVAGNDPYLLLNSAAAEVTGTDYVDTYSAGFEISSTAPAAINASAGSFIFLAIA